MVSLYTANFHGFPEMADIHRGGNASVASTLDGPADLLSLVTIIGSSMSLVGLVFGFLVHSLFSDVRSVAATGLMNLLATLFVAQVLFIALVEKARSSTAGVCLGLAFSLRFFWLAVFCWSTALAHHLYRSLKTNVTSDGTSNAITTASPSSALPPSTSSGAQEAYNAGPVSRRPLVTTVLLYSAVAWGMPLLLVLVAAVIVASSYKETTSAHARHHSQFKGFRDCWLAGSIPIHVTFDIPVFLLTILNTYYFVHIGVAIRYVSSMQMDRKAQKRTSKRHFRQLFLHVKLYALQFIVWSLEVSAEFSGNHIMWLLFVIGFSLQGGLIALVYACNVKVMKIYLNALARPHRRKSCRTKGSMAVSHSASLELLKGEQWPEAL